MRKIIVTNNMTLDGVMQAPGRADEDTRGGFLHGGWAQSYNDEVKGKAMGDGMSRGAEMLFGRRTYEDLYRTWHGRTDNPFSAVLENARKYVVSRTLKEPLPWKNSTLLRGDGADAVSILKRERGPDLVMLGSGELLHSLMRRRLVDEFVLLIHPLVFGIGRPLFASDGTSAKFTLIKSVQTPTGVIIATYQADRVRSDKPSRFESGEPVKIAS